MVKHVAILASLAILVSCLAAAQQTAPSSAHVDFGVVTYLSLRHLGTELGSSIKPSAADRTNYLDAIRELGATTIRDTVLNWAELQPRPDTPYDFAYMDDLVRKATDRGLDVLALVYFFPPSATAG